MPELVSSPGGPGVQKPPFGSFQTYEKEYQRPGQKLIAHAKG
eukprot:COSAG02_NODE_40075_length_409_cov_1.122581_1_plen_41_part_10